MSLCVLHHVFSMEFEFFTGSVIISWTFINFEIFDGIFYFENTYFCCGIVVIFLNVLIFCCKFFFSVVSDLSFEVNSHVCCF